MKRKLKKARMDIAGTETLVLDMLCPDPECNGKLQLLNKWELKGKGKGGTIVRLYACQKCGTTLRKHEKLPKSESEANE